MVLRFRTQDMVSPGFLTPPNRLTKFEIADSNSGRKVTRSKHAEPGRSMRVNQRESSGYN